MDATVGARKFLVSCRAMDELTHVWYLLPLRLFCGWSLLNTGLGKLSTGWLTTPELATILNGWLRDGKPYGFYAPFLRTVVLPHAHLFSIVVSFGELLVGAALLAGLFTRIAAAAGMVLAGNFLFARGDGIGVNGTAPFLAMFLTIALTNPGRALGLDGALRGRVPRWLS
jgi:thiosulfate dehydrogenase [quinone] large subunit